MKARDVRPRMLVVPDGVRRMRVVRVVFRTVWRESGQVSGRVSMRVRSECGAVAFTVRTHPDDEITVVADGAT